MEGLSIIIVNFNVKYFLAQCLESIYNNGVNSISYEVIVVDNCSQDGSIDYLSPLFKNTIFIENEKNVGFGSACNIGAKKAQFDTLLFLNPDTLVANKVLENVFLRHRSLKKELKIGGLGCKLVDPKGVFHIESRRSFPTPLNSFFKMSGLSAIFGNNKVIGQYNLNYLEENVSTPIEVLCGAFIMIEKSAFWEVNGFDPRFFMYGEDIDLSLSLHKAGYVNYYYADEAVIHYKGESSKTRNRKYYKIFYDAMKIYASKHFGVYQSLLLQTAITVASCGAQLKIKLKSILKSLLKLAVHVLMLYSISMVWASLYYGDLRYYHGKFFNYYVFIIPIFFLLGWRVANLYINTGEIIKSSIWGFLTGSAFSLGLYALLPEQLRFGRAPLILFLLSGFMLALFNELLYSWTENRSFAVHKRRLKKALLISDDFTTDYNRVFKERLSNQYILSGIINPSKLGRNEKSIGHLDQLKQLIENNGIGEVVIDSRSTNHFNLIKLLKDHGQSVNFKFLSKTRDAIIGKDNSKSVSNIYLLDYNFAISNVSAQNLKRTFDIIYSLFSLVFFFGFIFKEDHLASSVEVLFGKKTWVGYNLNDRSVLNLPSLKEPVIQLGSKDLSIEEAHRMNMDYAKNYTMLYDIDIILKKF